MENKKKNLIIAAILIVLVIAGVTVYLILNKSNKVSTGDEKNIISSLDATSQTEIDNLIKKDLETNKYTLKDARIYINPYGSSPLSALIIFTTNSKTTVDVTVKGKNSDDLKYSYAEETKHYIPIYGLYENYTNTIEIKTSNGENETFTITTGDLEYAPSTTLNSNDKTLLSANDLYFITSPIAMRSFALDGSGEVRFYLDDMYYHNIVELENGHMMIGTGNTNEYGLSTKLIEIDYLGRIYNEYNIEEGYINDFFIKEDGNIIVTSKSADRDTLSDYIIEINGNTGKIVKTVDMFKLFEEIDPVFVNELNRDDYFYNSGIEYYKDSDTLLLTYWGGEFVLNLNYSKGTINWIFSNPENFTSAFDSYLLKGTDGFTYPKAMHSATLVGNTLKVLDNGYSTVKNDPNSANLTGAYSSANTYTISGKNISLSSAIDEDKKYFSYAIGDYEVVNTTDEIVLFGRELTDLDFASGVNINEYDKLTSKMIEKIDGKTALDLTIDIATYSVTKIDVTKKSEFNFDTPASHTSQEPTKHSDLTKELLDLIGDNETIGYEFGYSKNTIENNVMFMDSDEAKMILVNDSKKGYVYDIKVKGESKVQKIITDIPNGKYYIYVYENGVMYKTNSSITIE